MRRRPLSSGSRGGRGVVPGTRPGPARSFPPKSATSDPPGRPRAPRPRRLTISERPSRQAFWKRAWRSSWGRSLKPVYLICKRQRTARNQEPNPRSRPHALPPRAAPISPSTVCGQTVPGEIARPRAQPAWGTPRDRAVPNFSPPGAHSGRAEASAERAPARRPSSSPHIRGSAS